MLKSTLAGTSAPRLVPRLARLPACQIGAVLIAASLALAACAPRAGPISNTAAPGKAANSAKQQAARTQYADIPVPKGRKINIDKTVVVGTDVWYGQLTFDTGHSAETMFDFYTRELPNYGWRRITSVRAQTSFMTYDRLNRVMTLAIKPNRLLGSEVMITVSPREQTREQTREQAEPLAPPPQAGALAPAPVTQNPLFPPPQPPR